MSLFTLRSFLFGCAAFLALLSTASGTAETHHKFTFVNKCAHRVRPKIVDVDCIYTTCDAAQKSQAASHAYAGTQPGYLKAGGTTAKYINAGWLGRIFNSASDCGSLGENCSMAEFNLDTGSIYTPQAYDISNIQGFTDALQIKAEGCDTVTCRSASCACSQAYPVGDMSGCESDYPVRACGAGPIKFEVVFCP